MVNEDLAFLQQIFDQPEDQALRLVYADWLEERGNAGAQLLRVRHELGALAPQCPGRKQLEQGARELAGQCDEEWQVLLDRADWKLRYLELEPSRQHRLRWQPSKQVEIGKELRAFEAEFGKLPRSYKAFAHVFGPGEVGNYFRINVPCPDLDDDNYDLGKEHREQREFCEQNSLEASYLFFAFTIGGEPVVWNPRDVCDEATAEYRVSWLNRSHKVYRTASSFSDFIDMCLKVLEEGGVEDGRLFYPYSR